MTVPADFPAAIAVYRDLGWHDAVVDDVRALPLGTIEQRRTALAGLRSGAWPDLADVDPARLARFAVRVGVDPARTIAVLSGKRIPDDELTDLLADRGPTFADRFLRLACTARRRPWEHALSFFGGTAVRLVHRHQLEIPDHLEYLKDWAAVAASELTDRPYYPSARTDQVPREIALDRLTEHLIAATAAGLAVTGPFGPLLVAVVEQDLVPRPVALDAAFTGLDTATRPGDRVLWTRFLLDTLACSDAELSEHLDALTPVLAAGDAAVIETLGVRLIACAPDDLLVDVATTALTIRTRKGLRTVLAGLAAREAPPAPVAAEIVAQVADLLTVETAAAKDPAVAKAVQRLHTAWSVAPPVAPEPVPTGLLPWPATPPLWQVPAFELPAGDPALLTELAAALMAGGSPLVAETFVAVANDLARTDPDAVRSALQGVPQRWVPGLEPVHDWVRRRVAVHGLDRDTITRDPVTARDQSLFQRLGAVPCLLSTPSTVDLRITLADLVSRLRHHHDEAAPAIEADLLLALCRLDLSTATADLATELADLPVPVVLQQRAIDQHELAAPVEMSGTAGAIVRAYLDDPLVDPGLELDPDLGWCHGPVTVPSSLAEFPPRIRQRRHESLSLLIHPTWGDSVLTALEPTQWSDPRIGQLAGQLARSARPLPPGGAMNLLATCRAGDAFTAASAQQAVQEAWDRGLLRPGLAEATLLGWSPTPHTLAALTRVLLDLAAQHLLPVIWPVLDDLLAVCGSGRRMPAGTADLAEAMATLLPSVLAAVRQGHADPAVLDLPGVRTMAARPGSSGAVTAARAVVDQLPTAAAAPTPPAPARGPDDVDQLWAAGAAAAPLLDDGVEVQVSVEPRGAGTRLCFDLTLPSLPGRTFQVRKGWTYDLQCESQCEATEPGADPSWLYWDGTALAVSPTRDRFRGKHSPLSGPRPPGPLPQSFVTVVIGLLGQDPQDQAGRYALSSLVEDDLIGSAAVTRAMRVLLPQQVLSPARMVGALEDDRRLLPHLWPLLTESIAAAAGTDGPVPRWLNRILDVTGDRSADLVEAARRGLIPAEAARWPGLTELAARPGTAAALKKARALLPVLLPTTG